MAVDITNSKLKPLKSPNMIEIMRRSDIITSLKLKAKLSSEADILVKPNVAGIHWSDLRILINYCIVEKALWKRF